MGESFDAYARSVRVHLATAVGLSSGLPDIPVLVPPPIVRRRGRPPGARDAKLRKRAKKGCPESRACKESHRSVKLRPHYMSQPLDHRSISELSAASTPDSASPETDVREWSFDSSSLASSHAVEDSYGSSASTCELMLDEPSYVWRSSSDRRDARSTHCHRPHAQRLKGGGLPCPLRGTQKRAPR